MVSLKYKLSKEDYFNKKFKFIFLILTILAFFLQKLLFKKIFIVFDIFIYIKKIILIINEVIITNL